MDEPKLVKLAITTEGNTETLWAELINSGLLRLDNAPFFAYGVSAGDFVDATPDAQHEGIWWFEKVREKCGNRTVRIFSENKVITEPDFKPVFEQIRALGCDFEGFPPRLVSITVPQKADLASVCEFLTSEELTWEYADPTYEDQFGSEDAD